MNAYRSDRKGGFARRFVIASLVVGAGGPGLLGGCIDETYIAEDRTDRTPRELQLTHHVGGALHRGVLHDGTWYVSQGPKVMAIEPRSGKVRGETIVVPEGTSGPILDMVVWRGELVVAVADAGVARLDLGTSREPAVLEFIDAEKLGIRPTELSIVDDAVLVSGHGGVVRLSDRRRFLRDTELVGPVVPTSDGAVAVVDRRVVKLDGGDFVGAATDLEALPSSLGIDGGIAFVLQSREGATVGIMGPDVRERSSDVVPGRVRRLRVLDERLWVVTDSELVCWDIKSEGLANREVFKLKGGRDLDAINDNYIAVVGSFGRAVLRVHEDATGPGDEFLRVAREPGRFDMAISDQRTLIGSSIEGTWSYPVRGKPTLTDRKSDVWAIPAREVDAFWGTATLAGDGSDMRRVEISGGTGGTRGTWTAPFEGSIWVLAVVDGDLWIGHDRGISVLRHRGVGTGGGAYPVVAAPSRGTTSGECPLVEIGSIVCEGPVFHLSPLRTGQGASFVSHSGGFGVAEWVIPGKRNRSASPTSPSSAPSSNESTPTPPPPAPGSRFMSG